MDEDRKPIPRIEVQPVPDPKRICFAVGAETFRLSVVIGLAERAVGLGPRGNPHPDEHYHEVVRGVRAKLEEAGLLPQEE